MFRFILILKGREHLKQYLESIIAKGGEGVVLRDPQSMYKAGRSDSMRKFKPFFDTEVKVVENSYPQGLTCEQYSYIIKYMINTVKAKWKTGVCKYL